MGEMICSRCHRFGIYWKNLGTLNEHTYCPHCQGINCQALEIKDDENDENEEEIE